MVEALPRLLERDPELVVLFDGVGRGRAFESSDIDLLVVIETKLNLPRRSLWVWRTMDVPGPLRAYVLTPEEFAVARESSPLVREAMAEGEVLYRKGSEGAMRNPPEDQAPLWLEMAGENLRMARVAAQSDPHSFACFHAQQAAEFALKAQA